MFGYVSSFQDIIFVEGDAPEAQKLSPVKVDLSFHIGAQLKNLNDVKKELVVKCRNCGGNCVCQFNYGQKSRWLAIDDVAYFGNGIACILSPQDYNAAVEKINSR